MKLAHALALLAVVSVTFPGQSAAQNSPAPAPAPRSALPEAVAGTAQKSGDQPQLRNITPGFAAAITSTMNIELPPPQAASQPQAAESGAAAESAGAPNNATITRLAPMVIPGERPPVFRERDLYNPQELQRLALLRYRGLSVFPTAILGFLNNLNKPIAEQIYREEERMGNIQALNETMASFARAGDSQGAELLRQATISTYKHNAPSWQSPKEQDRPLWTNDIR